MKKNKLLYLGLASMLTVSTLAGCGSNQQTATGVEVEQNKEIDNVVEPEKTVDENVETKIEEDVVVSPFISNLEKYDSVISTLSENQYYAFAGVEENDLLLVSDDVFDDGNGNMISSNVTIYSIDANGDVIESGNILNEDITRPIAVYEDYLIYGGEHYMNMSFVQNGSLVTYLDASEGFDENGNAQYYVFNYAEQFEGEVKNNDILVDMITKYDNQAILINFFNNNESEISNDNQSTNTSSDSIASSLVTDFKDIISSDVDVNSIADKLSQSPCFIDNEIAMVTMDVEEGYLNGFDSEIKGFIKATMFSPMIGSMPFIGYVFETDNADALKTSLEESAQLNWNICTMADEMVCEINDNLVLFVMAPTQFE